MNKEEAISACMELYNKERHKFEVFLAGVRKFFEVNPALTKPPLPTVHSLKSRLKDPDHLRDKLERKWADGKPITPDNFFSSITDLAGIRVLHLYLSQFPEIHKEIMERVESEDWVLDEEPVAYSWDPESSGFFSTLGIRPEIKPSFYTSIHYVIRGKRDSPVSCEIQVRTLFEEIWGEIDHAINYPSRTDILTSSEQIKVLAKLVSTGTRLADSIFRCHDRYKCS
jgi:ppGpp synthetase/RelA/SpoT-type nucleotidyltranferase